MAVAVLVGIIVQDQYVIPEFSLNNMDSTDKPIWPYMFVTVACGAISGFHATQSPMVAIVGVVICPITSGDTAFRSAMTRETVLLSTTYLRLTKEPSPPCQLISKKLFTYQSQLINNRLLYKIIKGYA